MRDALWLKMLLPLGDLLFSDDDDEDETEDDADDGGGEDDDSTDDAEDDDVDEEEDEDDGDKSKSKKKPTEAQRLKAANAKLQGALRKERIARRTAQREARAAKKATPAKTAAPVKKAGAKVETEEAEESARTAAELTAAKARETRLAERYKVSAVDNVIIRLAPSFKFADPEDALKLVSRKDIDVDQDDEDPTDVDIDEATVRAALKKLARLKPHLLVQEKTDEEDGEDDEEEVGARRKAKKTTGSKFSGKRKRKENLTEETLRATYSALGPKRGI